MILILFLFPITVTLLLSELVYVHNFLIIYFLPFFCLSTSAFIDFFKKYLDQIFIVIIYCLTSIIIFWTGYEFLQTLQKSHNSEPLYNLSQVINKLDVSASYLVESQLMMDFYPVVWNYTYGVKKLEHRLDNLESFKKNQQNLVTEFDYLVILPDDLSDKLLLEYINHNFQITQEKDGIMIYNL